MDAVRATSAVEMKILCLHGEGTNSEILEAQTAALRYHLGQGYEYDYLEGGYAWPAAQGINEAYGAHQIYYSYLDGTAESAVKAIEDLAEYVTTYGPFDTVLGFSLGAALAATLILNNEKPPFKCAIFLSGVLPFDWQDPKRGEFRLLQDKENRATSQIIRIPTVHAWSTNDTTFPGQAFQLTQLCEASNRVEVLHSAGHSVPSGGDELMRLVDAIRGMMARIA